MNALMNIQIRVMSAQALREFAKLSAAQQAMIAGAAKANAAQGIMNSRLATGMLAMEKWGNKAQWAGRQLTYNFTMPLLLAGGAAVKFALDNEKAMTRVSKVYGDGTRDAKFYKVELVALGKAFEMLSNRFGVARADVINIAADWAAAGASGISLAKATKLTIETMILGEMDAAKATSALISIQAQYGLSTEQLSETIDVLNMTENQTGISMQGLVDGMQRASGVARNAGVDVRHLAAMLAALTPAAGSAAKAGQSLKTVISRLMSPTKETTEVLNMMGIETKNLAWQSLNGTDRLNAMGKAFSDLDGPAQLIVSTTLASRHQLNSFSVLVRDMISPLGYYQKSLNSTGDAAANLTQKEFELNAVLSSSPQRLKIIWTTLQNGMADVVQPMLKYIVALAGTFVKWATSFKTLDPRWQKLILYGALLLGLLGPILKYLGSIVTVFTYLGRGLLIAAAGVQKLLIGMWKLLIYPFVKVGGGLRFIGTSAWAMMSSIGKAFGLTAAFNFLKGQFIMLGIVAQFQMKLLIISVSAGMKALAGAIWTSALRFIIPALIAVANMFTILLTPVGIKMVERMVGWMGTLALLSAAGWMKIVAIQAAGMAKLVGLHMLALINLPRMWGLSLTAIQLFADKWIGGMFLGMLRFTMGFPMMWAAMFARTFSIQGIGSSVLLAMQNGFRTASVSLWLVWSKAVIAIHLFTTNVAQRLGLLMAQAWWVTQNAILGMTVAFRGMMLGVWTAFTAGMTAIWGRGLAVMRAMWAATVLFLTSPLRLLLGLRAIAMTMVAGLALMRVGILIALKKIGPLLLKAFTGPWGWAIMAVLLLLSNFRTQITTTWKNIVDWFQGAAPGIANAFAPLVGFFNRVVDGVTKAFWRLPLGVQGALLTVMKMVKKAAMWVYDMFSYMNPFARHSPSLVENVTKGMEAVAKQYSSVTKPGIFSKAIADIAAYKKAMLALGQGGFSEEKSNVAEGLPSMLPLFNKLEGDLKAVNTVLAQQEAAVNKQQAVVDLWESKLNVANLALDLQQAKLDGLQSNLDALTSAYDAHSQAASDYASAPIVGMKAMNDAIFANSMEQKALQLQMLKMGDAGSIDKLRDKYAKLQGEIETLRGTSADLRAAGAGSDVLSAYDAQISALEAQQTAVEQSTGPINDMAAQLEALQHQAEIMDLENALQFDPLKKQIDDIVNATQELTFEEIISGVQRERAAMDALQPAIDAATTAVANQKLVVDQMTAARDAISATYDVEKSKLELLNDEYSQTESIVRDIESALRDMGSAASSAISAAKAAASGKNTLTPAGQNFQDALGADYPEVGGENRIGRESPGFDKNGKPIDPKLDQGAYVDEWVKTETKDMGDAFGKIDMWGPFKDMWNKGWKWMETNVFPHVSSLVTAIKDTWTASIQGIFDFGGQQEYIGNGVTKATEGIGDRIKTGFDNVSGIIGSWWTDNVKPIIDMFAPDFIQIWDSIYSAGEKIWNELLPMITDALKEMWPIIKVVAAVIGGALLLAFKVITNILAKVLKPILHLIIDSFKNFVRVIKGVAQIIVGIFTLDGAKIWAGIKNVFGGIFSQIGTLIVNGKDIVWGAIEGLIGGIIGFFQYLWDVLVGHSIIPDTINAIVQWFKDLGPWVVEHVKTFITNVVEWFKTLPGKVWNAVITLKDKLGKIAKDGFNLWWTNAKLVWVTIGTWLAGLGSAVWGKIKSIATKIGQIAKDGFNLWWTNAKLVWVTIGTWLAGLGAAAWEKIKTIATKIGQIAKDGFNGFLTNAKALWNGTKGILSWFGGLAKSVAEKMGGIGTSVANAIKGAWNGAAKWINSNGIKNINRMSSKLGFTISELPTFQTGGIVPGRHSKTDNVLATLRSGEGVIVPEAVKAIGGASGLGMLNKIAANGGGLMDYLNRAGVPGYKEGGVAGWWNSATSNIGDAWNATTGKIGDMGSAVAGWAEKGIGYALSKIIGPLGGLLRKSIPGDSHLESFMATTLDNWALKAKSWGDAKDKNDASGALSGTGTLGGQGWVQQMKVLQARFPEIRMTSGYRPGAITASGNPSMHGLGRAVDIPPQMKYFDWLRGNYGQSTAELIFTPAGARQIKNGQSHIYGEPVKSMHRDHIHWGYDNGGYLKPGMTRVANASGKPEPVFSAAQWATVKALVNLSASVLKSSVTGSLDSTTGLRGASLVNAQGRLRGYSTTQTTQPSSGRDKTELHFHGNLEFPNIKNGEDAKYFIQNLESLAG